MTLFIPCQGTDPDYINVSEIVSLSWDDEDGDFLIALLRDGRKVTLAKGAMEMESALTVIPAQPGQHLLLAYQRTNGIHFEREPLIAWRVTMLGGELRPVTARGTIEAFSTEIGRAVLNTDGSVTTDPYDQRFSSEDIWRAAVQAEYKVAS